MNKVTEPCPICGRTYNQHPALSRIDNKTYICPDCGTYEAFVDAGLIQADANYVQYLLRILHDLQTSK
jgi:rubrerythrin